MIVFQTAAGVLTCACAPGHRKSAFWVDIVYATVRRIEEAHTLDSRWAIWRWRLLIAIVSSSTIPSFPTPEPARYSAQGQPRPPAPMMRTLPLHRPCWPAKMFRGLLDGLVHKRVRHFEHKTEKCTKFFLQEVSHGNTEC
jgi:hypothetical protein